MDRDQSVRAVNAAISRSYNSLATYVLHSSAYTTDADAPSLKAFESVEKADRATAAWLTERLRTDFGAGPTLKAFEYWNVDLNYLSVPYLVAFSHGHFVRLVAEYEGFLAGLGEGDAALRAVFSRLLDEAKAHRDVFAGLLPKG